MQGDPRRDREWEHWPGRGAPDDGVRHRLRSLFSPTDSVDAVEALIAARGRELEERTEQLAETIADLEHREERARELRMAVEQMLRNGSAELDARHAELAALAEELVRREAALAEAEQEVELRRQELGAVELRKAALERKETALEQRSAELERLHAELAARVETFEADHGRDRELDALQTELEGRARQLERGLEELVEARRSVAAAQAMLVERERRLSDRESSSPRDPEIPTTTPAVETAHVLFLAGDRYRLEERPGPAPSPNERVEVDGATYAVARIGSSPLPEDRRRCAFLVPVGV